MTLRQFNPTILKITATCKLDQYEVNPRKAYGHFGKKKKIKLYFFDND